ncbi:interleukin-13 receptor subunit alpha-1-like isoform X1, partial [Tachysurus ichikawai]
MRLCGLLMSCLVSLVLADENGISKIRCLIYNETLLRCSWITDSLPEDAQYSASYQLGSNNQDHPLHCVINTSKKLVKCQAEIKWEEEIYLQELFVMVNITINDHWYIICQRYEAVHIEILNPPKNIRASIKSKNLAIQWSQAKSFYPLLSKCFVYEVKINDELVQLEDVLEYNLTNFVPTRSYTIQIRTKLASFCVSNSEWSDWSEPEVTVSSSSGADVNPVVIASIVFVLPMILLAFLLVCKFQ